MANAQLSFASGSLKQFLEITYDDKLASEATPPDDVEGELYKFIPADYTKSRFAFDETVEEDAKSFKPHGEKIGSYARLPASAVAKSKGKGKGKGKTDGTGKSEAQDVDENTEGAVVYEMYKVCCDDCVDAANLRQTTWDSPGFREYHRRMQLFILMFIEGGSYVHVSLPLVPFFKLMFRKTKTRGSS